MMIKKVEMTEKEELAYIDRWMSEGSQFVPPDMLPLLMKHYPEMYEEDEFALDEGEMSSCYDSRKSDQEKRLKGK